MTSLYGQAGKEETLDEMIARRADFLTAYQNAETMPIAYLRLVRQVRAAEERHVPNLADADHRGGPIAVQADGLQGRIRGGAAAYGDRVSGAGCEQEFEGDFAIKYHLAPPILSSRKGCTRAGR